MAFALPDLVGRIRIDTSDLSRAKGETDGFGSSIKTGFVAAAAAVAATGAAATAFAASSVSKFKEVGGEVVQLTRATGGTAEAMSRLRFAAKQSGVDTADLSQKFVFLSKNLSANADKLKDTGISFKDAHGKLLPLDKSLVNIAEKFKSMPGGIEKNTLAVKLFGRSGADLIPLLNRGKDGIEALEKASDKYGTTLTQKNLDAIRKNTLAHKDLDAAMEGLKIQVGAQLMPILASMAQMLASVLVPALGKATAFVKEKFGPVFTTVWTAVQKGMAVLVDYVRSTALPWIVDRWSEAQPGFEKFWNVVKDAFRIAKEVAEGTLIPALQKVWSWLWERVKPAAEAVADTFQQNLLPAIGGGSVALGILGVASAISGVAQSLEGLHIPDLLASPGGKAILVGGALLLAFGNLGDSIKSIKDDLAGLIPSLSQALGIKTTIKAPAFAASDQDLGLGMSTKSFSDAMKNVDWKQVAGDLVTALGKALQGITQGIGELTKAFGELMSKVKWGDIGREIGKQVPVMLLGLITGILNFDIGPIFSFIGDHWAEILIGILTIAFAPAKMFKFLEHIPFGGMLLKVVEAIQKYVPRALKAVGGVALSFLEGFAKEFGNVSLLGDAATAIFRFITRKFAEEGPKLLTAAKTWIKNIPSAIVGAVEDVARVMGELIATVLQAIVSAGVWLLKAGGDLILGLLRGLAGEWPGVTKFFTELPGKIAEFFLTVGVWLFDHGMALLGGLARGIGAGAEAVWNFFRGLLGTIGGFLGNIGGWLRDHGLRLIRGLVEGILEGADAIWRFFAGIPRNIGAFVSGAGRWLLGAGKAVMQGLIDGIESMLGPLGDALGRVTQWIKDHKGPPSKDAVLLKPAGALIVDGLIAGLNSRVPALTAALRGISTTITSGLDATANVGLSTGALRSVGSGVNTSAGSFGPGTVINNTVNLPTSEFTQDQLASDVSKHLRNMELAHL